MEEQKLEGRLGLDTTEFERKLKDTNSTLRQTGRSFSNTFKEQKALIRSIEADIKNLNKQLSNTAPGKAQQNMFKELRGAKKALSEETGTLIGMQKEQAVVNEKVMTAGGKLAKMYAGIAIAIGSVAKAFQVLKNAVLESDIGLDNFNITAKVTKQLMYDILHRTPLKEWGKNLKTAAQMQGYLNELRRIERESLQKTSIYQVLYNKSLVDAHDLTRTAADRVKAYDNALENLNNGLDEEQRTLAMRLGIIKELLKIAPHTEAYLEEESRLTVELINIEDKRYSRQKEISSMRSGLIKKERDEALELLKTYNKLDQITGINPLPKQGTPSSVFEKQKFGFMGKLPGIQGYSGTSDQGLANDMAAKVADLSSGLSDSQMALVDLAGEFSSFFSDVNLGFQGMIDGVITGIKRLVAELIAKAVFLAILSAIFPAAGVSLSLENILGGSASKLFKSGASASLGGAGAVGGDRLLAEIGGDKLRVILQRT